MISKSSLRGRMKILSGAILKFQKLSIAVALPGLLLVLAPNIAYADGSIYPDSPELSNPLNTAFNYTVASSLNGAQEVYARPGTYAYRPAIIKISDQQLYMWECSSDGHGDGIFFLKSSDSGKSWTDYGEVVRSSMYRNDYLDYAHACDPSVTTDGSYYYIFYTGAPDWGSNTCSGGLAEGSCDNRIFVARVPIGNVTLRNSYQKLVDVGECASAGCFQYQPFWQNNDLYAPVPIIRNEIGSVWRRIGTGSSGYTTEQTSAYGIGQPSAMNVFAVRIWYTSQTTSSSAEMVEWDNNYNDFSNGYNMQNHLPGNPWAQRVSNTNDVDYNVAFDSTKNRYIATIAGSPDQPCVNYAIKTGIDTTIPSGADPNHPDATNNEIITRNLRNDSYAGSDGKSGCLSYAGTYSHNDGFVRDANGYLVTVPNPSGSNVYWVYYADNYNMPSNYWHIARIPFTVQ